MQPCLSLPNYCRNLFEYQKVEGTETIKREHSHQVSPHILNFSLHTLFSHNLSTVALI